MPPPTTTPRPMLRPQAFDMFFRWYISLSTTFFQRITTSATPCGIPKAFDRSVRSQLTFSAIGSRPCVSQEPSIGYFGSEITSLPQVSMVPQSVSMGSFYGTPNTSVCRATRCPISCNFLLSAGVPTIFYNFVLSKHKYDRATRRPVSARSLLSVASLIFYHRSVYLQDSTASIRSSRSVHSVANFLFCHLLVSIHDSWLEW